MLTIFNNLIGNSSTVFTTADILPALEVPEGFEVQELSFGGNQNVRQSGTGEYTLELSDGFFSGNNTLTVDVFVNAINPQTNEFLFYQVSIADTTFTPVYEVNSRLPVLDVFQLNGYSTTDLDTFVDENGNLKYILPADLSQPFELVSSSGATKEVLFVQKESVFALSDDLLKMSPSLKDLSDNTIYLNGGTDRPDDVSFAATSDLFGYISEGSQKTVTRQELLDFIGFDSTIDSSNVSIEARGSISYDAFTQTYTITAPESVDQSRNYDSQSASSSNQRDGIVDLAFDFQYTDPVTFQFDILRLEVPLIIGEAPVAPAGDGAPQLTGSQASLYAEAGTYTEFSKKLLLVGITDDSDGYSNDMTTTNVKSLTEGVIVYDYRGYGDTFSIVAGKNAPSEATISYTVSDIYGNTSEVTNTITIRPEGTNAIDKRSGGSVFPVNAVEGNEINLMGEANDFFNSELSSGLLPGWEGVSVTAKNGTVETIPDPFDALFGDTPRQVLNYTPSEGYSGYDEVTVTVRNTSTGEVLDIPQVVFVQDVNTSIQLNLNTLNGSTPVVEVSGNGFRNTEYILPDDTFSRDGVPYVGANVTINGFNEGVNVLPSLKSGESEYVFNEADLANLFTDTDGDTLTIKDVVVADSGDDVVESVSYDASTGNYTVNLRGGYDPLTGVNPFDIRFTVDDGTSNARIEYTLDVFAKLPSPSIEAGVEGEDFIFSKYQSNNENNYMGKRGFSEAGDYWIKSKNGYDELIGNGQEVAFIAGSRDIVSGADIDTSDILSGLRDGSIVATRSFASYDGIYNIANFEAGSLDDLLSSGEAIGLTRIDAQSGEQLGGSTVLDPTRMYDLSRGEFTNSLSAQNGNDFGSIIAADPTLGLI